MGKGVFGGRKHRRYDASFAELSECKRYPFIPLELKVYFHHPGLLGYLVETCYIREISA